MKRSKIMFILFSMIFSGVLYAAPFAICCSSHHVHDGLRSFWVGMDEAPGVHNTQICKKRSYDDTAYGAGNCKAAKGQEAPFGVCCKTWNHAAFIGLQTPPTQDNKTSCKQLGLFTTNSNECYTSH